MNESSINSYLKYLQYYEDCEYTPTFYKKQVIDKIASHFDKIEKEKLFLLTQPIIHSILINEIFKVSNQDELFDFNK